MNLSKKLEKAIDIAGRIMSAVLSSGIDSDEDGSISEAIEELSLLKNKPQICLNRGRQKTDTIFLNIPYRPCITGLMRKNMGRNTS